MMSALPMLVLVLIVLGLIGYPLRWPIRQALLLRRALRVPIGQLPHTGIALIIGRAIGNDHTTPLTNTPCVFWHVEVLERGYKTTRRLFHQSSAQPFRLDDGTGDVLVFPESAQFQYGDENQRRSGLLVDVTTDSMVKLTNLGLPSRPMSAHLAQTLRVYERYIAPAALVYALGVIDHQNNQVVLRSNSDTPLFLAEGDERSVRRHLYRRIASTIGAIVLIVFGFGCLVLLSILDRS